MLLVMLKINALTMMLCDCYVKPEKTSESSDCYRSWLIYIRFP